jgi:hypothetical protein
MRRHHLALTAALIGALAATVSAQRQVQLLATIVDATGAPLATLSPKDIDVAENGVAGTITNIEAAQWAVKLQLLIDNGLGMRRSLNHLLAGLRGLVGALPDGIEVTLVATAPQPRLVVRPTTDREEVLRGIDRLGANNGAGRFVDALYEATERIERDKGDFVPVIVTVASMAGDRDVRERDIEQIMQRLQARPGTVHVVLLSEAPERQQSASRGLVQSEVGQTVTKMTGGRYEEILAAGGSQLAALLPELGALVAAAHGRQRGRFLITVERPAGASGELGEVSVAIRAGLEMVNLSLAPQRAR